MNSGRQAPIFGLDVPLLFAHRGGAKEAPESTKAAFRHAINYSGKVLELDVQVTEDRKVVVWHGPIKALVTDETTDSELKRALRNIPDTGVDGIMTDYPKKVGEIMKDLTS